MSNKKKDKPRMKLPNDYGSVSQMSNPTRRRKPYAVRIPAPPIFDEATGKMIRKNHIIGYAATKEEGYQMLAKYHEQPFDLELGNLTFREVYDLWAEEKYNHVSQSSINGYRAAYNACTTIYERKFRDLKTSDLQKGIDNCGKELPSLKKIRVLFNQIYAYGMKNDLCQKDYSSYIDLSKHENTKQVKKVIIKKEQLDILWDLSEDKYYQMILILIYTGVRINELLNLKKENVNLEEQYFDVVKSKTENGIRKVPISKYILPFFKNWYNMSDSKYVFHPENIDKFEYRNYRDSYYTPIMLDINKEATIHCCRHTFITMLAEAQTNPTFSKKIVGHKGAMSMTEKVYTHIDIKTLINVVNNNLYYPETVKGGK